MKKSTKLVLLALWHGNLDKNELVHRRALDFLLPELTKAGRNSLYRFLESRALIAASQSQDSQRYVITGLGISQLFEVFPSLQPHWSQWQGDWQILVFYKPTKRDPQFRYLRKQCLSKYGICISRGVYLFARVIPIEIAMLIKTIYQAHVIVMSISSWQTGVDASIVMAEKGLNHLESLYSGVSSEADELLNTIAIEKRLTNAQKQIVLEMYYRIVSILEIDPGYTRRYFSTIANPLEVISKLKVLLTYC